MSRPNQNTRTRYVHRAVRHTIHHTVPHTAHHTAQQYRLLESSNYRSVMRPSLRPPRPRSGSMAGHCDPHSSTHFALVAFSKHLETFGNISEHSKYLQAFAIQILEDLRGIWKHLKVFEVQHSVESHTKQCLVSPPFSLLRNVSP